MRPFPANRPGRSARRTAGAIVLALLLAACGSPAPSPPDHVFTDGPVIRDAHGGELFLRGFDLANRSKTPPFFPGSDSGGTFTETSPDALDPLLPAGLNTVRFLVMWEAVEPSPGVFDGAYLDHVERWVHDLGARGFQVIVDMHQDLYSRAFDGAGDGAPAWSCPASNYAAFAKIYDPSKPWFSYYLSQPITACFDHLWQDGDGVQEQLAQAWAAVAARVAKEPGLLGYDLLNEPWPGSTAFIDGTFGATVLWPFYQKVTTAIRAVDPDHLIFVEPAAISVDALAPSGFPALGPGFVYYPHYYDVGEQRTGMYSGTAATVQAFQYLAGEAAAMGGVPWALGEYADEAADPERATAIADAYAQGDAAGEGIEWWEIGELLDATGAKVCAPAGVCPLDLIARPHPLRVAGTETSFSWDAATSTARLVFADSPLASGTTDVALPGTAFAAGPRVTTSDPSGWTGTWDASTRIYHYTASSGGPHTLVITPGP